MNELAAREDPKFEIILEGAINAVQHRIKLWDGIYNEIKWYLFDYIFVQIVILIKLLNNHTPSSFINLYHSKN